MVVDRDWKVKGPACLEVPFKELAAEKIRQYTRFWCHWCFTWAFRKKASFRP